MLRSIIIAALCVALTGATTGAAAPRPAPQHAIVFVDVIPREQKVGSDILSAMWAGRDLIPR